MGRPAVIVFQEDRLSKGEGRVRVGGGRPGGREEELRKWLTSRESFRIFYEFFLVLLFSLEAEVGTLG